MHADDRQVIVKSGPRLIRWLAPLNPRNGGHGADEMSFKGKLFSPDGAMRGLIVVSSGGISIEKRGVFLQRSASYSFKKLRSIRVERGWFHTRVRVTMEDGSRVELRTRPRHYRSLKEVLKEKL